VPVAQLRSRLPTVNRGKVVEGRQHPNVRDFLQFTESWNLYPIRQYAVSSLIITVSDSQMGLPLAPRKVAVALGHEKSQSVTVGNLGKGCATGTTLTRGQQSGGPCC